MSLTKWIKPNGTTLHLNDEKATVKHAYLMNWKPFDESEAGLKEAKETIAKAEAKLKSAGKAASKGKAA